MKLALAFCLERVGSCFTGCSEPILVGRCTDPDDDSRLLENSVWISDRLLPLSCPGASVQSSLRGAEEPRENYSAYVFLPHPSSPVFHQGRIWADSLNGIQEGERNHWRVARKEQAPASAFFRLSVWSATLNQRLAAERFRANYDPGLGLEPTDPRLGCLKIPAH